VPFLRHARDKRGYETTFVMHSYRPGQGPSAGKTRLLYLFRSPSSRKVGRSLLDPEVMEALEHTHPDLTFDWTAMLRTPAPPLDQDRSERGGRGEGRDRGGRQDRHDRNDKHGGRRDRNDRSERRPDGQPRGDRQESGQPRQEQRRREQPVAAAAPAPVVPDVPAVVIEDDSLLGKTLGAIEAARMRSSYNELLQRIARRARTPEERDRLIDRATRLNPDEWVDEAAITAGASSFASEWEAIREELPRRRRGRRGGRGRDREPGGSEIIGHDQSTLTLADQAEPDAPGLDDPLDGRSGPGSTAEPDAAGSDAGDDPAAGEPIHNGD
jgi:hypothetical protein